MTVETMALGPNRINYVGRGANDVMFEASQRAAVQHAVVPATAIGGRP